MTTDLPRDGEQGPVGIDAELPAVDPAAAAVVDRASAELAASTDRDPSPGLLPAVMETVWAELRPGQQIPLPGSDGTLLVTETAVGNALVAHLDGMPELLVRRCVVEYRVPGNGDNGAAGPAGESPDGTLGIALTAAVAYGTGTGELVERIRSVISLGAEQLFGLTVGRVDVDIVDVYPAPGTPR